MAMIRSSRRSATAQRAEGANPRSSPQEEIARMAYELYERRGRIDGHDLEDWFGAERIVTQREEAGIRSG